MAGTRFENVRRRRQAADHRGRGRKQRVQEQVLEEKDKTFTAIKTAILASTDIKATQKAIDSAAPAFAKLEADWIAHYTALHSKARLRQESAAKKQAVRNSPELKALYDLSHVSVAPKGDLDKIAEALDALEVCAMFDAKELKSAPLCRCGYSPKNDGTGTDASAVLSSLPEVVKATIKKWNALFLSELAKVSLELLKPEERSEVEKYMAAKEIPVPVPKLHVSGLENALGGLRKITVALSELGEVLKALGPSEPAKVQTSIASFFDGKLKNVDISKARLVFE